MPESRITPFMLIKKRYTDFPAAHRQPKHKGHCSEIHGHNWSFEFTFEAEELDENGFVIDFGELKWLRQWLTNAFDHTVLLCADDIDCITALRPYATVIVVENGSCESLAKWIFRDVSKLLTEFTKGRVKLFSVVVFEDSRNSAIVFSHDLK